MGYVMKGFSGFGNSPAKKKGPCWKGYEMVGMKKKGNRTVPNCVPSSPAKQKSPAWQRKEGKNPTGGLNEKGRQAYKRDNPGSTLSAPVTKDPSKLKKGSKSANRRKSFCARMSGMKGPMMRDGKPTRKKLALDKWNC